MTLHGQSGSQRALAEGTLAAWLQTGDGCYLDNADPDTLREICRILAGRLPDVRAPLWTPEGETVDPL